MSSTRSNGGGSEPPSAAEQAYFQAIEAVFVRLRGAPLLLSPADWRVAQRWYREGVPLALVEGTLEEVFARREESGRKGKIQSLRYCASAVESAWSEIVELQATGERPAPPALDVESRLEALASSLPAALPERGDWAARIRTLEGASAVVEKQLAALDEKLLDHLTSRLSGEQRQELDAEVVSRCAVLAARLSAEEVAAARQRLARQLLRRHWDLPVLSLFAPQAEG